METRIAKKSRFSRSLSWRSWSLPVALASAGEQFYARARLLPRLQPTLAGSLSLGFFFNAASSRAATR